MDGADLKLQIGEPIQLQPRDGEDVRRFQARVIGYLPGHSLLVTTPRIKDKVIIVREGQPFVVRLMAGNRIVGFATTVLRSCARPYPYLHLSYPEELQQIVVRNAQRVAVKLFASLKNEDPKYKSEKPRSATIVDISTTGALVTAGEKLGEVGQELALTCVFRIGGAEKLLSIPSRLRNVHVGSVESDSAQESFYHGLEFDLKDQDAFFALHGFVYEQIVKAQTE
jgi:c-di-GMP-binding flagellar brake protein YcgR